MRPADPLASNQLRFNEFMTRSPSTRQTGTDKERRKKISMAINNPITTRNTDIINPVEGLPGGRGRRAKARKSKSSARDSPAESKTKSITNDEPTTVTPAQARKSKTSASNGPMESKADAKETLRI